MTAFRALRPIPGAFRERDDRCERFACPCRDIGLQRLTFVACTKKRLAHARPMAHIRIGGRNGARLLGIVSPVRA